MNQRDADEQRKLTRRVFIQYSAAAGGAALGAYGMTLKSDAVAQQTPRSGFGDGDDKMSYLYR